MKAGCLALLAACLLPSAGAAAPWTLDAGLLGARPAVLTSGQLLGASFGATRGDLGLVFGARLTLGAAAESNLTHRLHHTEAQAQAVLGYRWPVSLARVAIELGAGPHFVHERRVRHQSERLRRAELEPLARTTGWTLGPSANLDLVVHLYLLDDWALALRGGPRAAYVARVDEAVFRLGWATSLGVSYRFGGRQ